jgi:hypothetical protein
VSIETNPHPTGWLHDPGEVQGVLATMPMPLFGVAAPHLWRSGANQTTLLYKAWKDVNGSYIDYPAQEIGCCVSRGFGHGVDLLQCVQVSLGKKAEKFTPTSHEFIYGTCRVDIGGQRGSYQDGAVGAWAAKAVSTIGTVSQELVGPYDDRKCKEWGARGVPANLKQEAAEHQVLTTSLVTTYEELEDALANGFPVTVCSNQGFTMSRDQDGFCQPRGSWAHCCPPEAMVGGLIPKRAEHVHVGDHVLGHDGVIHQVSAVMARQYKGSMVSIAVAGLPPVRFTPEHPVRVERTVTQTTVARPSPQFELQCAGGRVAVSPVALLESRRDLLWIQAKDVRPGDCLVMPYDYSFGHMVGRPEWFQRDWRTKNVPLDISEPDSRLAWLFGLYIANGNSVSGHKIVITLPSHKEDVIKRACFAVRLLGLEPTLITKEKHVRIIAYSSIVADTFRYWFGGGNLGPEKKIPEFLFDGWDVPALVDGIHAGDGDGANLPRPKIYTTSRTLLNQLWMILVADGRRPAIHLCSRSRGTFANAKPLYAIQYARETDYSDQRKKNHPGYRGKNYVLPVKAMEQIPYDGLVYNFEVEGSNSYVADGVAVHNCMLICGVRADSRPGACIFQSWGSNVPSGPLALDQPPNSFWADKQVVARMLGMQDSWALSAYEGYPGTPLPSAWTYGGFI